MTTHEMNKEKLSAALDRLSQLLHGANEPMDLVVCGGVIASLYFNQRETHDVDAIFPDDPYRRDLLNNFIKQVSKEQDIKKEHEHASEWMNPDIEMIGLESKSKNIIYKNKGLTLRSASWQELTAQKLTYYRNRKDLYDAVLFLNSYIKEHPEQSEDEVFEAINQYRPFVPRIPDKEFRARYDALTDIISPNRSPNHYDLPPDFSYKEQSKTSEMQM